MNLKQKHNHSIRKYSKEIFNASLQERDIFDKALEINGYWKVMRVTSLVKRFITNAKKGRKKRVDGLLTTNESESTVSWWTKRAQQNATGTPTYRNDELMLNLQKNADGLLECRREITRYIPNILTSKIIVYREECYALPPKYVAWGSSPNYDASKGELLDSSFKAACKAIAIQL